MADEPVSSDTPATSKPPTESEIRVKAFEIGDLAMKHSLIAGSLCLIFAVGGFFALDGIQPAVNAHPLRLYTFLFRAAEHLTPALFVIGVLLIIAGFVITAMDWSDERIHELAKKVLEKAAEAKEKGESAPKEPTGFGTVAYIFSGGMVGPHSITRSAGVPAAIVASAAVVTFGAITLHISDVQGELKAEVDKNAKVKIATDGLRIRIVGDVDVTPDPKAQGGTVVSDPKKKRCCCDDCQGGGNSDANAAAIKELAAAVVKLSEHSASEAQLRTQLSKLEQANAELARQVTTLRTTAIESAVAAAIREQSTALKDAAGIQANGARDAAKTHAEATGKLAAAFVGEHGAIARLETKLTDLHVDDAINRRTSTFTRLNDLNTANQSTFGGVFHPGVIRRNCDTYVALARAAAITRDEVPGCVQGSRWDYALPWRQLAVVPLPETGASAPPTATSAPPTGGK